MLSGCGAYDSGHKDGYAAGYNTTCNIRGALVEDSWNPVYKKGYKDGYKEGSVACMRRRQKNETLLIPIHPAAVVCCWCLGIR